MSYIDLQEVKIEDASGNLINPAQDETVVLLRRLVQIASTLATQDSAQRQRISIDAAPATLTATVSQGSAASLNTTVFQGTASNLNATVVQGTASNLNANISVATTLNQFAGVDIRFQMVDWARTAYNTGIRANLINS